MKKYYVILSLTIICIWSCKSIPNSKIINSDIDRFWNAYDQIVLTNDTLEQYRILEREYIEQGTKGLGLLMEKRGYTAKTFIDAINKYPKFWESVRQNTLQHKCYSEEIGNNIEALKELYSDLKPAQVFFTIGALMTAGQEHKGHVLIGAELAMADSNTVVDEIEPFWLRENLALFFESNPIDDLVLLNVHEYVHTQQGDYGYDLLSMCVFEGVAEFISTLAAKRPSACPAIAYGQKYSFEVKSRFEKEMFSPHWNDWLYNDTNNEFEIRDLGYYVGYAICENYYNQAIDKKKAIKEMIELRCDRKSELEVFVDKSGYFDRTLKALELEFYKEAPVVNKIIEFDNNGIDINPTLDKISIRFSEVMNQRFRNFRFGPKGKKFVLPYSKVYWLEDGQTLILEVELKPDQQYQLEISNEFRNTNGKPISPYLINFKTSK